MSAPSSNWLALRKVIAPSSSSRKRKRAQAPTRTTSESPGPSSDFVRGHGHPATQSVATSDSLPGGAFAGDFGKAALEALGELKPSKGNSLSEMRALVLGTSSSSSKTKADPKKYVALDCEMVGVGADGTESSLARVSVVDYHGAVLLDVFVKQREHVADWRTHVSGVRESDMKYARPFDEVQKEVAKLLEGRILVGHALSNDMQALLLSHPRPQTRDTQLYCGKLKLTGSRPSLRNLAKLHFGIDIQQGEHSSVIDARAAMAIYRVHSKVWEQVAKGYTPAPPTALTSATSETTLNITDSSSTTATVAPTKKRKRADSTATPKDGIVLHLADSADEDAEGEVPREPKRVKPLSAAPPAKKTKASAGKPLKAKTKTKISSGLSTVVRGGSGKGDKRSVTAGQSNGKKNSGGGGGGDKWWTTLGGAKGSVRI